MIIKWFQKSKEQKERQIKEEQKAIDEAYKENLLIKFKKIKSKLLIKPQFRNYHLVAEDDFEKKTGIKIYQEINDFLLIKENARVVNIIIFIEKPQLTYRWRIDITDMVVNLFESQYIENRSLILSFFYKETENCIFSFAGTQKEYKKFIFFFKNPKFGDLFAIFKIRFLEKAGGKDDSKIMPNLYEDYKAGTVKPFQSDEEKIGKNYINEWELRRQKPIANKIRKLNLVPNNPLSKKLWPYIKMYNRNYRSEYRTQIAAKHIYRIVMNYSWDSYPNNIFKSFAKTVQKEKYEALKILEIENIDKMRGVNFEFFLAAILRSFGFKVTQTKGSGDMGVDMVVQKEDVTVAIQAKRYSKQVTQKAIREVIAGMPLVNANKSMVITNNRFTKAATVLAEANKCVLVDRDILAKWLLFYKRKDRAKFISFFTKII